MLNRINQQTFNSDGTWTAPAGVTAVLVWGMGGGAGGGGGQNGTAGAGGESGYGGQGNVLLPAILDVIPNTTYFITIGEGGAGGPNTSGLTNANIDAARGLAGGDTSFGSLIWYGAPIKIASPSLSARYLSLTTGILTNENTKATLYSTQGTASNFDFNETPSGSYHGEFSPNATTALAVINGGKGSGGCSGEGIGGTAGDGGIGTVSAGTDGGNAAANSGAGGGAGGGGASGSFVAGSGGNGGSGQIVIIWA